MSDDLKLRSLSDCYSWKLVTYTNDQPYAFTGTVEELKALVPDSPCPGLYCWHCFTRGEDRPSSQYLYIGECRDLRTRLRCYLDPGVGDSAVKIGRQLLERQQVGSQVRLYLLELSGILHYGRCSFTHQDFADYTKRLQIETILIRQYRTADFDVANNATLFIPC